MSNKAWFVGSLVMCALLVGGLCLSSGFVIGTQKVVPDDGRTVLGGTGYDRCEWFVGDGRKVVVDADDGGCVYEFEPSDGGPVEFHIPNGRPLSKAQMDKLLEFVGGSEAKWLGWKNKVPGKRGETK